MIHFLIPSSFHLTLLPNLTHGRPSWTCDLCMYACNHIIFAHLSSLYLICHIYSSQKQSDNQLNYYPCDHLSFVIGTIMEKQECLQFSSELKTFSYLLLKFKCQIASKHVKNMSDMLDFSLTSTMRLCSAFVFRLTVTIITSTAPMILLGAVKQHLLRCNREHTSLR